MDAMSEDTAARKAAQARAEGNEALAKFYDFCAPSEPDKPTDRNDAGMPGN